jgi:hypothetical protein
MIAILAGMGLMFAPVFGFARNTSAVQVTFFGSGCATIPDPSNFEDCGPGRPSAQAAVCSQRRLLTPYRESRCNNTIPGNCM